LYQCYINFNICKTFTCANAGYEVADRGCCGTGTLEVALTCNHLDATCPNVLDYVFWDGFHPTESVYKKLVPKILQEYINQLQWSINLHLASDVGLGLITISRGLQLFQIKHKRVSFRTIFSEDPNKPYSQMGSCIYTIDCIFFYFIVIMQIGIHLSHFINAILNGKKMNVYLLFFISLLSWEM